MKSAYELALERMERQGIAPPREESLTGEQRAEMAEIRRIAEAKLAELEILPRDKFKNLDDWTQRSEQEEYYRLERARIEADRDAKLERLRGGA